MQETVLGVSLPIVLLAIFEVAYRNTPYRVPVVASADERVADGEEALHGKLQGALAIKTIALALLGVGSLIFILGLFATHGKIAVLIIALVIVMLGVMLLLSSRRRSEEHTSELQSLMRISYAVFCLNKKKTYTTQS